MARSNPREWRNNPKAGKYVAKIEAAEEKYGIPPGLLGATIQWESDWNPDAVNPTTKASGLGQLMPIHWEHVDPMDADASIDYSAKLLADNHDEFDSWDAALALYNAKRSTVRSAIKSGDFYANLPLETQEYLSQLSPELNQYPAVENEPNRDLAAQAKALDDEIAGDDRELAEAEAASLEMAEQQTKLQSRGWLADVGASALRGPLKAVTAAADLLGEFHVPDFNINIGNGRPLIENADAGPTSIESGTEALGEPQTKTGAFTQGATQFAVGFYTGGKVLKALGILQGAGTVGGKFLLGTVKGAIADMGFFKGEEGNLAGLIHEATDDSVTGTLAGDSTDSELVRRGKNTVVGAGIGAVAEPVMHAIGGLWRSLKPLRDIEAAHEADARPELDIDAVAAEPIHRESPRPAPVSEAVPEGSAPAKIADDFEAIKVNEVTAHSTIPDRYILPESTVLKSAEGHISVTPRADGSLHITSAAASVKRSGTGRRLVMRAVEEAEAQGKSLHGDTAMSNDILWTLKKLRDEGKVAFDVDEAAFKDALDNGGRMDTKGSTPVVTNIRRAGAVAESVDEATGEIRVRSDHGSGLAIEGPDAIRIKRVDVAEASRGKGEGLSILKRFAQRAASRGIKLFSDVSVSPAQARVYAKLKAEGFDVHQNESHVNPDTGNLVSADPRQPVFEVAPKVEAAPVQAEAASTPRGQAAAVDKPAYDASPIDVTEARLREEIGLTDEMVSEVRGKLERGEIAPEKVSDLIGINGDRLTFSGVDNPEGVAGLLNTVARVMDDTVAGAARFAKVSVDSVTKMAREIGATADEAYKLFETLKANGGIEARVVAAKAVLKASAVKLFRLGTRVANGTASPEEMLEFAIHDRRHMLIQAVVRGIGSQIGRALRMMRESIEVQESGFKLSKARSEQVARKAKESLDAAKASGNEAAADVAQKALDEAKASGKALSHEDALDALSKMGYTPGQLKKLARRVAEAQSPTQLHAISRTTGWGNQLQSRLATLYINNILSGFSTYGVNIASGWLKLAETVVERYGAAAFQTAGKLARGKGFDKYDWIAANRAALATRAMWGSSWKIAAKAWKEGLPQVDLITRDEIISRHESTPLISHARKMLAEATTEDTKLYWQNKLDEATSVSGRAAKNLTYPSRVIMTTDEFFKEVFYQQELTARATEVAAAKARLFKGKAQQQVFEQEFQAIMESPPDDLRLDAINNARYQTFQLPLESNWANGLIRWTNGTPALKLVVPFVKTPVNIMKQAVLERTPLALLRSKIWKAIRAGGREGHTVAFRTTLATGAFAYFFHEALEGAITGSRAGDAQNKNTADLNQQIAYTWNGVQYNRLDPFGTTIGLAAETAALYKDYVQRTGNTSDVDDPGLLDMFGNAVGILSEQILDKTFFKGLSDAIVAAKSANTNKERAVNYVKQLGANLLVPYSSMQRGFARTMDDYAREAFTFADKLKMQTPGLRETLPLARDYLGRPLREPEMLGPDFVSPIAIRLDDPDPAAKAVAELELSYQMPDRKLGGVQLTAEQYSRYCEIRGDFIREKVQARLDAGQWYTMPRFRREDFVKRLQETGGQKARNTLLHEAPDLKVNVDSQERALEALRRAAQ